MDAFRERITGEVSINQFHVNNEDYAELALINVFQARVDRKLPSLPGRGPCCKFFPLKDTWMFIVVSLSEIVFGTLENGKKCTLAHSNKKKHLHLSKSVAYITFVPNFF